MQLPESSEFYFSIEKEAFAEFKDRGSRFLAYAFPIDSPDNFKKQLQSLKKDHPKAVHHCFGYRLGIGGDNYRVSDDGEPSGTAGKQILGQIDSKQLTNIAVIVIRYFGGTLLGVPGLINAYKTATALALQTIPAIRKQVEVMYSIEFDYNNMNEVMQLLKKYQCSVMEHENQLFSLIKAGVPKSREEEVVFRMREIRNVSIKKVG